MRLCVRDVNRNILVEEKNELVYIAIESSRMQEVEALVIGDEGIGAVFEKEVDNVIVASFRGP